MSEMELKDVSEDQEVVIDFGTESPRVPLLGDDESELKKPEVPHDGSVLDEEYSGATFGRLLMLAREEFWLLALGTVGLLISSGSMLIIPHYAGKTIDVISAPYDSDSLSTSHRESELKKTLVILLIWSAIGAVFAAIRSACFTIAGERLVARIRKQVYSSIIKQDIGFFDVNRTGELTNRLSSDPSSIKNAVTINMSMILRSLTQAVGSIIILFLISWKLTLLMMIVIPIISVSAVLYGKYVKKLAKQVQDALAKASEVAEETISNVRTVRSFSQEPAEEKKYHERVEESYILGRTQALALGCFVGVTGFVSSVGIVIVIGYGGILVINGEMTPGMLTEYILYTIYCAVFFGTIAALYGDFMKAIGASSRLFQLLDREPLVHYSGGEEPEDFKGVVEFRDVHFTYPSRPDAAVLKGLSLNLQPGKVHALVGPSGGGKSTCIALMELFYYCQKGAVLVDGVDIKKLSPQWLRQKVGLVTQEPTLFACSVAKNIGYGVGDEASQGEVEEMSRIANAHEFVAKMPEGYNTEVGEHGIRLSGGQKQRVAIARALLPSPSLLLLDEATSALDAESEHLVHDALDSLLQQKEKTVLVIAHRLSTVKNADVVFVIDGGTVQQQGTHDELVRQQGLYRQLVLRQLQKDTLEDVDDSER